VLGRNTQGVTLIKVAEKEKLVGVERICDADEDEEVIIDGETGEVIENDVDSSADEKDSGEEG